MESPVDKAEYAARVPIVPDRVQKTGASAKEKDEKFSKVLREKMKKEQQEKRKRKNMKDEVVLSNIPEDTTTVVESAEETDESEKKSSTSEANDEKPNQSVDLRA